MKKQFKILLSLLILVAIIFSDWYMTHSNFIVNSNVFVKNDFEITQHDHPQKVWDKVFFGNSVVISSFIEDESKSGYINCGLDYGVVTDLWEMIKKGHINIGSELVIGLNYLTLYDDFDTNPTYIWHKKPYQPYAYFERDRFYPLITDGFNYLLNGKSPMPMTYTYQEKAVYHGRISDTELENKMAEYETEFFNKTLDSYSENLDALESVIAYCQKNNIKIRAVHMPWNPMFEKPEIVKSVHASADAIFSRYGVEVLNLEDEFPTECFYDTGHLNYDVGSVEFTKRIDEWL